MVGSLSLHTSTHFSKAIAECTKMAQPLIIGSIDQLSIKLAEDVETFLEEQYGMKGSLQDVFHAMKRPPKETICRINQITTTMNEVQKQLEEFLENFPHVQVLPAQGLDDVLRIVPKEPGSSLHYNKNIPDETAHPILFTDWPTRSEKGWPMTHRVVLCDRFCGEAVLRGSDIFVRGILAADAGIQTGEEVAVYADIRDPASTSPVARGLQLDNYVGQCVYLGLGTTACSRKEMFVLPQGVGIHMSQNSSQRVGPCLPPLSGILENQMMLQNLPSVYVGHALNPQPGETIMDLCAAPGGKSSHLASRVCNSAVIVSCDKSRKKVLSAKQVFERVGATCITPIALDSTKCVDLQIEGKTSVKEILDTAPRDEDGLAVVKKFPPESFDRVLLDPPCSALGLRPKLFVEHASMKQLQKHANYQQKFASQAVALLKPGGFMTYSTCTISILENERMIRHILNQYPCMELVEMDPCIGGQPGLPNVGLSDTERVKVRRFDPHNEEEDTMGFFLALLRKRKE
eukprot:Nitzschia sp. Nitz4//scaffold70_size99833//65652//67279//NITZ4_004601-RA/size99833-snap-gene-0.149-mRNA-1//-1//CDS//3329557153//3922//frame0